MGYDIIGDVHGHAAKLTALLRRLGYHAFNAVAGYMPDPECDGEHLRRRIPKNREQHEAFLAETGHDPALHTELVGWFLTLPLWLDLPGLRVVRACWHPGYMAEIGPLLMPGRRLDPALVVAASRPGSMAFRTVEGLTKGLEIALPAGHAFVDKGGHRRSNVRVRWWDAAADTYRKAALLGSVARADALPDLPIPEAARIGYAGTTPVFFGHYRWTGVPGPLAAHVACVDYSAGVGGPLVAYRWNGESVLQAANFVSDASTRSLG